MQSKYFLITEINNDEAVINVGKICGIYEGTIVGLYPIDTQQKNKKTRITKAEVIYSGDFTATIKLDKEVSDAQALKSWVFVEEKTYGEMKINIYLSENINKYKKVKSELSKNKFINFVEKNQILTADMIIRDSTLKAGNEQLLFIIKNTDNEYLKNYYPDNVEQTAKLIKNEAILFSKTKYLKELELYNPDIDLELQLVPVLKYKKKSDNSYIATELGKVEDKIENGQIKYVENDLFVFKVINNGEKSAYFQIVNIQPDNGVEVLIPPKNVNAGDIKIEAKDTLIFKGFIMQVAPPFETDIFKIIASPEPMYNLREIIENKKTRSVGESSPFEILAEDIITGTRGTEQKTVPTNTVNINSFIIKTAKE